MPALSADTGSMNNPWTDLCGAATGVAFWGCHFAAWSMPVLSGLALLLSIGASAVTLWHVLRRR
jgi:hypothetical protein